MAAPRALVAVEYAWGRRRARVDRDRHGWIVRCGSEGGREWRAERDDSEEAKALARAWVEGRVQGPYHQPRRRGEGSMRQLMRLGMLAGLSLGVVSGSAAELRAQTLPYPVPATAQVVWDHPGATATVPLLRFELQVDSGAQADLGVPTPGNAAVCGEAPKPLCTYAAAFPAVQPGTRVIRLRACNEAGCSEPVSATVHVFVAPVSPSQLRIVIGGE